MTSARMDEGDRHNRTHMSRILNVDRFERRPVDWAAASPFRRRDDPSALRLIETKTTSRGVVVHVYAARAGSQLGMLTRTPLFGALSSENRA